MYWKWYKKSKKYIEKDFVLSLSNKSNKSNTFYNIFCEYGYTDQFFHSFLLDKLEIRNVRCFSKFPWLSTAGSEKWDWSMFLIRPCHGALLYLLQQMLGNYAIKAGFVAILSCQHYRLQIILFDNITDT